MKIQLGDHFSYKKLIRFVLPPILMMVFTSIYGVVDGFFISNYTGKTAFAAVNLIMPFLMILGSIGFMLGTGGTAIVSKLLGEKRDTEAKQYFSLFIVVTLISGLIFTAIGEITMPYIAKALIKGKDLAPEVADLMLDYAVLYGRIVTAGVTAFMLQNVFQAFFSAAEKPTLGFVFTVSAGCVNIIFDGVLVGACKLGVTGAAIATIMSQYVGAIAPMVYFSCKNKSLLRFVKPKFNAKVLLKACTNGSSEFVSNISMSIVSIVYNYQLLKFAGENGVSTYGVLMYVNFIYYSIFIGYAIGTAPIIGYNYGANNSAELKNIFKKSMVLMAILGVLMTGLAGALANPISKLYVGYDRELFEATVKAFYIYSFSFIFAGFAIFSSSMFTALGNGLISALISFVRTIILQIVAVFILPLICGVNGIWASLLVSEILATIMSMIFCVTLRKKYHY